MRHLILRARCSAFFAWAMRSGLCPSNALAGYRKARSTRAERLNDGERHGRALSDAEIAEVWKAAEHMGSFGGLVRFLILTGCRRAEAASMTWAMLGADRITLPASHTKQGRPHEVPVTAGVRAVLAAQERTSSPLVFPSSRSARAKATTALKQYKATALPPLASISGWSKSSSSAAPPRCGRPQGGRRPPSVRGFGLHDLRRTVRTGLSALGVRTEVAEAALAHQSADVLARAYDRHEWWVERFAAMERWSARIDAITGGIFAVQEESASVVRA